MAGQAPLAVPWPFWTEGVSHSIHLQQFSWSMRLEQADIRVSASTTTSPNKHIFLDQCNSYTQTCFLCSWYKECYFMQVEINRMTVVYNCAFILMLLAQMWTLQILMDSDSTWCTVHSDTFKYLFCVCISCIERKNRKTWTRIKQIGHYVALNVQFKGSLLRKNHWARKERKSKTRAGMLVFIF
jgi:hypothetical protein